MQTGFRLVAVINHVWGGECIASIMFLELSTV
jgi:hypothetical protein